jgi:hypothetical protein
MIEAPYRLPERPLSQELLYFISVANVIIHADLVVPLVIVVPIVELILHRPLRLALAVLTHVEYLRVVDDLLELILSQVLLRIFQGDLRSVGFSMSEKLLTGGAASRGKWVEATALTDRNYCSRSLLAEVRVRGLMKATAST